MKFFKSVQIWQNCDHERVAPLFWLTLYMVLIFSKVAPDFSQNLQKRNFEDR